MGNSLCLCRALSIYEFKSDRLLGLDVIHEHCPSIIDTDSLKPMDTSELAPDCIVAGGVIYKESGDRAIVLGRPKTRAETIADSFPYMLPPTFDLHGDSIWT